MNTEPNTRRPTGKPPWPILLIAGAEKAGKSYACAAASACPAIGRTLWLSVGEDDPDEYGALDGADFEILLHGPDWASIVQALQAAVAAPRVDAKPTLLVVDSMTREWDLLSGMAQEEANRRAARKGRRSDVTPRIDMDQWNTAKQRHQTFLDLIRSHNGPVLLTARLERQVIVDDEGQPTKERDFKVKAEKGLPFDVGAVVMMPSRGENYVTGVRSLRWLAPAGERVPEPDFTVAGLWEKLGLLEPDATAPRQWNSPSPQAAVDVEENITRAERPAPQTRHAATRTPAPAKATEEALAALHALAENRLGSAAELGYWVASQTGADLATLPPLDQWDALQVTWATEHLQQIPEPGAAFDGGQA